MLGPETNETVRAGTLTVSENPNSDERILPMNMVQTRMKIKPAAGVSPMALKLWAKLDDERREIVLDHLRDGLARRGKQMEGGA